MDNQTSPNTTYPSVEDATAKDIGWDQPDIKAEVNTDWIELTMLSGADLYQQAPVSVSASSSNAAIKSYIAEYVCIADVGNSIPPPISEQTPAPAGGTPS
jgi:hypothetical protein